MPLFAGFFVRLAHRPIALSLAASVVAIVVPILDDAERRAAIRTMPLARRRRFCLCHLFPSQKKSAAGMIPSGRRLNDPLPDDYSRRAEYAAGLVGDASTGHFCIFAA